MIVRISTEGQFRVNSTYLDKLNEIDEAILSAVANENRDEFQKLFNELLDTVRSNGEPLDPEELVESTIVLPPPDTTFEEARELFVGDGVIPSEV